MEYNATQIIGICGDWSTEVTGFLFGHAGDSHTAGGLSPGGGVIGGPYS